MKKLLSFFVVVCLTTSVFAQQQIATLLHNDSITVYYGANAFKNAHNAAINGDIITLSSGTFNSVDTLNKAIIVRGIGMSVDTIGEVFPTILTGDIKLNLPNSNLQLVVEGIRFTGNIYYVTIYNPLFVKCKIPKIEYSGPNAYNNYNKLVGATFVNCIINEYKDYRVQPTVSFINSYVEVSEIYNPIVFTNSVVKSSIGYDWKNSTFANCIIYCTGDTYGQDVRAVVNHCVGINSKSYGFFTSTNGIDVHNYSTCAQVFKSFNGTYSDVSKFDLLDSIATTILGSDSTQVGVFGGSAPFDTRSNPLIGRTTVGRTTTSEGKLEVEIQITTDSE